MGTAGWLTAIELQMPSRLLPHRQNRLKLHHTKSVQHMYNNNTILVQVKYNLAHFCNQLICRLNMCPLGAAKPIHWHGNERDGNS